MKKLNKKGFTLVELLAVIVILALLIVVVATTALPAMRNAKKDALETYANRVVEQAKGLEISSPGACPSSTPCDLADIMGEDNDDYDASLTTSGDLSSGVEVNGTVEDSDGNKVNVCDNVVQEAACS